MAVSWWTEFWKDGKNLGPDPNLREEGLDYTRTGTGGKLIPKPAWMSPVPFGQWQADVGHVFVMLQASDVVLAGGRNQISAVDVHDGEILWQEKIEGDARGTCAVDGALIISTTAGKIFCFAESAESHLVNPRESTTLVVDSRIEQLAAQVLEQTEIDRGLCVDAAAGDRVFEVKVQDQVVAANFNIASHLGSRTRAMHRS